MEREKYPDMKVIASKTKNDYTEEDFQFIIQAKQDGMIDANIAQELNQPYWSVVYKW